uniref:transposase n=1 Tax=Limosilactobacillus reuteri TaxID=1598 RepID=UPI0021F08342
MSFIAVDGDRSCLFELLEDRRLRSLFKHYQQFKRRTRCRVKYLVMDMNAAYDQLVKTVFPCAQIIYDRFHIAKHLNDTMNHVRIHVFNRLRKGGSAEQKQARRLKHYWRLFLQDRENLSTKLYYEGRYFNRVVNSMIILDLMLGYDQELRATYNFIQSLKHAYNQRDFTTFFQ